MSALPDTRPPRPAVRCESCEAVCCRLTVVLMPEDRVPVWLVDHDAYSFPTLAKNDEGWCAAIDPLTFRCTIYADRPGICRKFARGSPGCRSERERWYNPPATQTDPHASPTAVVAGCAASARQRRARHE